MLIGQDFVTGFPQRVDNWHFDFALGEPIATFGRGEALSDTQQETEGLTDSIIRTLPASRTQSDSEGLTDSLDAAEGYNRLVADNEGTSDSLDAAEGYNRTVTDSENLTDSVDRTYVARRIQQDMEGLTDVITIAEAYLRSIVDSEGITDSIDAAEIYLRTIADSEGLTDSVIPNLIYNYLIQDTEGLTDSVRTIEKIEDNVRVAVRTMKQKGVYWELDALDEFGKPTWKEPIEIDLRWEDAEEEIINPNGERVMSRAQLIVDRDLTIKGVLWLGELDDIGSSDNPKSNDGAWEIIQYLKTPDFKGRKYLREAYL